MARAPYRILASSPQGLRIAWRTEAAAAEALSSLGLSRSGVAAVLSSGRLAREGVALAAATGLTPGDVLELAFETVAPAPLDASIPAASLLWVDPWGLALAADKPAHLLVHGDGSGQITLSQQVAAAMAQQGIAGAPQALQRLDQDTSGVVLFSLHPEFQPAFDALVASHDPSHLSKRYFVLVEGVMTQAKAVDVPVGRDRHDARRMHGGTGKEAHSFFEPLGTLTLASGARATAVSVAITTGRRHQIRVHAAALGHPVAGDILYGAALAPGGLMLHSWQETLVHPVSRQRFQVEAAVPSRFPEGARQLAEAAKQ